MKPKQTRRMMRLLEEQNKMLEVLVAAEYANAQATEGLMQAFEGGHSNSAYEASVAQMQRMAGLGGENPRGRNIVGR
jgi:hypothetical protein